MSPFSIPPFSIPLLAFGLRLDQYPCHARLEHQLHERMRLELVADQIQVGAETELKPGNQLLKTVGARVITPVHHVFPGQNSTDKMKPATGQPQSRRFAIIVAQLNRLCNIYPKSIGEQLELSRESTIHSLVEVAALVTCAAGANGYLSKAPARRLKVMFNQPTTNRLPHISPRARLWPNHCNSTRISSVQNQNKSA